MTAAGIKDARPKRLRKLALLRIVYLLTWETLQGYDYGLGPRTSATVRRMLREETKALRERARKL